MKYDYESEDRLEYKGHGVPVIIFSLMFLAPIPFLGFFAIFSFTDALKNFSFQNEALILCLLFSFLFVMCAVIGGITLFAGVKAHNTMFCLDKHGVHYKTFSKEIHIPWQSLTDYGVSYGGEVIHRSRNSFSRGLHVGNYYNLYFSQKELLCSDDRTKVLDDDGVISRHYAVYIQSSGRYGYFEARASGEELRSILAFCERRCKTPPFIPEIAKEDIFI